jgi:hypothetical protein
MNDGWQRAVEFVGGAVAVPVCACVCLQYCLYPMSFFRISVEAKQLPPEEEETPVE